MQHSWLGRTRNTLIFIDRQSSSSPIAWYYLALQKSLSASRGGPRPAVAGRGERRRWMGADAGAAGAAGDDGDDDVEGDRDSTDTPTLRFSTLKRIIKPFLLKCHPDTTPTIFAKKVNLTAIQSLNGYLETIRSRLVSAEQKLAIRRNKSDPPVLELDFILTLDIITGRKRKDRLEDTTSRRRVELLYPPDEYQTVPHLYSYSRRELLKLLKVAGLDPPKDFLEMESSFHDDDDHGDMASLNNGGRHGQSNRTPRHQKSPYEISRDRFVRNIQWQNYDRLYEKAVRDMETDIMTEGLVQKYPGRRRAVIAQILSRVTLQAEIDIPTQLITFRRLSLLFDEHFFNFELEDHGKLWESRCQILLCPPRRNNSSSALHRRKEGGFLFTVHPNMTLTIHIPVDFRDEEFYKEIDNNIWHFYDLFEEDGMAELFPSVA